MSIEMIRIVADSSVDLTELDSVSFGLVPFRILTQHKEYLDSEELDVREMITDLVYYNGRKFTAAPTSRDWMRAFGDAEEVFCVTATSALSGSYTAALIAKREYERRYPKRRVFVLDTQSVGPESALIVERLQALVLEGLDFDEICAEITEHKRKTGLFFMLESMKNLSSNGKVTPLTAKMAGLLGIRVVGRADENGEVQSLARCRGGVRALESIVERLKAIDLTGGKIRISHCFNEEAATDLKERICREIEKIQVTLCECRGVCGFYAEIGGLLVGYERA